MQIARLVLKVALLGLGALAAGCDDPVPPSAQGAVKYRLGRQPTGPVCQATSPSETIGSINTSDLSGSTPLVDGEGNGRIKCTIRPSGSSYEVSASIQQGNNSFALIGTVTPGSTSSVTVNIVADSLKATYSSDTEKPCTLTVDGTSPAGLGVSPGKLRAIFNCTDMILSGATSETGRCAIAGVTAQEPGGYVFLDNCDE